MSENEQSVKGTILMVFMFRGEYLKDNLGHEIINLFKADDGNHYIYVNPWGHVNEKDHGKIDTILLVRHISNYQVEIIAKAWDLDIFDGSTKEHMNEFGRKDKSQKRKEKYDRFLRTIKDEQNIACENIRYRKRTVAEIFGFNDPEDKQEILVTYKAKAFRKAKKVQQPLLIDYDRKSEVTGKMPSTSLKAYYNPNDVEKQKMYEYLKKIIEDNTNWEKEDSLEEKIDNSFNILNVIGKEDDELAYSNWFCYLFNRNNAILKEFAKQVLVCNLSKKAFVQREIEHIDLLIIDQVTNQLIVVENKIKSDINGKENKLRAQEEEHSNENGSKKHKYRNQLHKYTDSVEEIAKKKGLPNGTKYSFYIFVPDYSSINYDVCKKEGYEIVQYSRIYEFFRKNTLSLMNESPFNKNCFDKMILEQFILALSRHIKYPDYLFENTYRQFVERIDKMNESE